MPSWSATSTQLAPPLPLKLDFRQRRSSLRSIAREEQGSLTSLLGDLQAAEGRLSATYPEIFSWAWADHETLLAALDDLTSAADRVRAWVTARHHAMA
jgi:hypothetical protein